MAQYIDKSALVAEIKRRIDRDNEDAASYSSNSEHNYLYRVKKRVYSSLLSFIETLEVKDMDLEDGKDSYVKIHKDIFTSVCQAKLDGDDD